MKFEIQKGQTIHPWDSLSINEHGMVCVSDAKHKHRFTYNPESMRIDDMTGILFINPTPTTFDRNPITFQKKGKT
jgi:hypothetical protein